MENIQDDYKNINKIVFEYQDKILTYEGENAKQLKKAIDGMVVFCDIHRANPFSRLKLTYKTELIK